MLVHWARYLIHSSLVGVWRLGTQLICGINWSGCAGVTNVCCAVRHERTHIFWRWQRPLLAAFLLPGSFCKGNLPAFPFGCMGQERELQMQRLLELFDAHLGARPSLLQMLVMLMWLGYHVCAGS